jgi:hypothetical protein
VSEFLDELARSMAKPLPRRRALRLLGGAVVAVAVPGFAKTTKAHGATSFHLCEKQGGLLCECNCKGDVCQRICCKPREQYECYCGSVQYGAACKKKCSAPCPSNVKCCKEDEFCANSLQQLCCKQGERGCGPRCCQPNEECTTIRIGTGSERVCEKRCPQGQAWCGRNKCCPPKWNCANEKTGLCKRCRKDQEECGKKCCDRKTSRCCGKDLCCKEGRPCCTVKGKRICCPANTKCVPQVVGESAGPNSDRVCCPPSRLSTAEQICCPPGQVALNTPGFRAPPPGISPYCCPPSMVCRSGTTAYCANLQSDPENCGSCGTRCASRFCSGGICVFP